MDQIKRIMTEWLRDRLRQMAKDKEEQICCDEIIDDLLDVVVSVEPETLGEIIKRGMEKGPDWPDIL